MRKWLLHLSISGGVVGILLWRARVWELGHVFAEFDAWAATIVVLLNIPLLLVLALRSWLVFRRLYSNVSLASLLPIVTVGNVAWSLTPANVGDLLRAYIYKREYGVPVSGGAAMIVYESPKKWRGSASQAAATGP